MKEMSGCPYQQDAGTCYYCNHQGGVCGYDGFENECPLLNEDYEDDY